MEKQAGRQEANQYCHWPFYFSIDIGLCGFKPKFFLFENYGDELNEIVINISEIWKQMMQYCCKSPTRKIKFDYDSK